MKEEEGGGQGKEEEKGGRGVREWEEFPCIFW